MPDFSRMLNPSIPNLPNIPIPQNILVELARSNLASEFYGRLKSWIKSFDASLDNEHEVGVRLVSFGQSVTFHLENLSYWDPSLISFSGRTQDGSPVELIQHVSQISLLLTKLPRANPDLPKRPIGFHSEGSADQG